MSRVRRHRLADRDLIEIYRDYARRAGLNVADRFFHQAEATFRRLAAMPGSGAPYQSEGPVPPDLRVAPVSRFGSYLVFYRPVRGGIEVLRVLHGARDLDALLGGPADDRDQDPTT